MGSTRTVYGKRPDPVAFGKVVQDYRRQPHQRTVARRVGIGGACEWLTGFLITSQRFTYGHANVEAFAGRTQVTRLPPVEVTAHLVSRIKTFFVQQTFSQAKCHGCVIGPLPRLQIERAAANHIGQGLERAAWLEFDTGADSICASKPKQGCAITLRE